MRHEHPTDHWYTPPKFLQPIIDANEGMWIDVMTSPLTPEVEGLYKYFWGDIHTDEFLDKVVEYIMTEDCENLRLWGNPPYSAASGGAQKHIERLLTYPPLARKLVGSVFLVNYDAWVPRLAMKYNAKVALVYPRIQFITEFGKPGPSPRHANALIIVGDVNIPEELGKYRRLMT